MFWSKSSTTNTSSNNIPSGGYIVTSNTNPTSGYVTVIGASGGGGSGSSGSMWHTSGTSNQVLTAGGWSNQNNSCTITGNLKLDTENAYISTRKHKINLDHLIENLQIINDMLHLIVPDKRKLQENPTLMDAFIQYDSAKHIEPRYNSEQYIAAYHQYKLLEALLEEGKNDNS